MFDFPATPAADQIFTPPGGPSYIFQSGVWRVYVPGATAYTGDAPPLSPAPGQLWWESDSGDLFIWYNDGISQLWVQVAGNDMSGIPEAPADGKSYARKNGGWSDITATLLASYLPLAGGTLSGNLAVGAGGALIKVDIPAGNPSLQAVTAEAAGIPFLLLTNPGASWQLRNDGVSGDLMASVTGSERLRIKKADGLMTLPGGLKLPALSADPAALDYYGEGTFTPTLQFGGVSTGITYSVQTGFYTRIGNLCFYYARVTLTNKGAAAGNAAVAGLPFTCAPGVAALSGAAYYFGMSSLSGGCFAYASTTTLVLLTNGATQIVQLNNTNFGNGTDLILSGFYQVA